MFEGKGGGGQNSGKSFFHAKKFLAEGKGEGVKIWEIFDLEGGGGGVNIRVGLTYMTLPTSSVVMNLSDEMCDVSLSILL